jgi:hypothetical protein
MKTINKFFRSFTAFFLEEKYGERYTIYIYLQEALFNYKPFTSTSIINEKKSSTLSKNKQFKTSLRTTQNTSFMEFVKLKYNQIKYDEWPEYVNVLVSFDILKSDNHRRR